MLSLLTDLESDLMTVLLYHAYCFRSRDPAIDSPNEPYIAHWYR